MHCRGIKLAAAIVVAATAFAVVLDLALVSAFDQPIPHHLSVAVTGPQALVGRLGSLLNVHHPGAFTLHPYSSPRAARAAVVDRRVVGAVVVAAHRFRLFVAEAGGASPARVLTATFGAVAAATGRHLTVVDLVPPAPGDAQALSPFFVVLGMLFPSLAAGVASSLASPRASTKWRLGLLVTTAVLMGLVVAAVAEGLTGLGPYPAVAGIVALFSLAVSVPTAGLSRFRRPAVALAVVIFVVLGISSSGGPSGLGAFSPGFFRAIDTALPVGAAATVLRNTVYFHGHATTDGLGVLAAWAVGGLAVLAATGRIRQLRPPGMELLRTPVSPPPGPPLPPPAVRRSPQS